MPATSRNLPFDISASILTDTSLLCVTTVRERPQYELALLTSGLDPGHMYLRYGPPLSDDVHPVLRPDDGPGPEPLPRPDDGPAPAHRQLRPTLRARQLLRLLLRLLLGEHGPADDGGHGEDCDESGHCSDLGGSVGYCCYLLW